MTKIMKQFTIWIFNMQHQATAVYYFLYVSGILMGIDEKPNLSKIWKKWKSYSSRLLLMAIFTKPVGFD